MKTRTTHCQKPSGFSQNQSLPVFPETVVGALCSDATEPHLGEYLVTWPPLGRLWAHVRVPCTPSVLLTTGNVFFICLLLSVEDDCRDLIAVSPSFLPRLPWSAQPAFRAGAGGGRLSEFNILM